MAFDYTSYFRNRKAVDPGYRKKCLNSSRSNNLFTKLARDFARVYPELFEEYCKLNHPDDWSLLND